MLRIEVQFDDAGARDTLARLQSRLGDMEGLHEAMGTAVADGVKKHIVATKQSPNTGWWARVARSVSHRFDASSAVVEIPERGAALRYYGGTVRQKEGGPLLAIPTDKVPVSDGTRKAPREMGPLAFLSARRPARKGVVGVLVEGELTGKTVQRGKRAGQPATRRKPGGSLLYVLMSETDHKPDPTVLPTDQQLAETARDAALDFVSLDL